MIVPFAELRETDFSGDRVEIVAALSAGQKPTERAPLMRGISALIFLSGIQLAVPAAAEMFGPDYPPCGDKPSTVDIVACVDAKTKIWNDRLNKAYKELPQRLDPAQLGPLKDAQRLWIKYRDANCGFYASQAGTIRQVQAAECLRSMTKDRALELESAMKFD